MNWSEIAMITVVVFLVLYVCIFFILKKRNARKVLRVESENIGNIYKRIQDKMTNLEILNIGPIIADMRKELGSYDIDEAEKVYGKAFNKYMNSPDNIEALNEFKETMERAMEKKRNSENEREM